MGIDFYRKKPVVWLCKSVEARKFIKFLETFINFYGFPEKLKADKGSAFLSKDLEDFCKNEKIEIE